jgi:signal transduction histidine kinase
MRRATFTISDISWRKQAEDQRLQKEKLQAVIETAGAVCHELNQPMQVSLMELIDLIQSGELAAGPVRERLEKIKDQLDAMRQLSRKLMRITRYETRDYIKGERIIDIDKASGV